jgi:hypothetical protein
MTFGSVMDDRYIRETAGLMVMGKEGYRMVLGDTEYRGICLSSFFLFIMTKKERKKAK